MYEQIFASFFVGVCQKRKKGYNKKQKNKKQKTKQNKNKQKKT